jgi:tRNA(Ser,Leu) C12 N-acetylase TAN1
MRDWNVIVSVYDGGFRRAFQFLQKLGTVSKSGFFNVLVMKVDDIPTFLEAVLEQGAVDPELLSRAISRIVPLTTTFVFQSPEEFEAKAKEAVAPWISVLGNQTFHIRMHRRGFAGRLSSQAEERFLDEFLLRRLEEAGTPGRIAFDDPDFIIAVETLGPQAGLSLWRREELQRYPFLKVD